MKKLLPLSLLTISTLVYADFSQQEFLYKDPRIMGMGAANTAVGGYSTAVFYNPAGLINIKKEHGVEVELLGISVSASQKIQQFADDLNNANNDTAQVVDTVKKYSGDVFNLTASNYTSVSYHTENDVAWSVGLLASADATFIPHANSGSNGLIEAHARAYGGIIGGMAMKYDDAVPGSLTVGLGLKYITQKSYEAGLDAGEVTDHKDDIMKYLQDTYEVTNSGFGVDIGAIYSPMPESVLNPSIGLSVMNLGSLNFTDVYGAQPMTVNLGFSISPELAFTNSFRVSVDYVDALNTQQARVRNYNATQSNDQYDNADIEFNMMQHLRAGVSAGLIDNSWFMLTLNGGLYQGAYTAGLDMQLAILKIQAATYQEQLGATVDQLVDRRYVIGLGIGW